MLIRLPLLLCLAAGSMPAQSPRATVAGGLRLVDRVEAPMLYLSLESERAARGEADAKNSDTKNSDTKNSDTKNSVHRLLADPACAALLGSSAAGADRSDGASRSLALVRGVLARSAGEVELALTGVLPNGGQPLLVLRARLQTDEAERLAGLLAGPDLAVPERLVGATQTFRLRTDAAPGPGRRVELAVVGDDLLVANDGFAMEELLLPLPATTSASPQRRVLSADPRFNALKKQLASGPGSLVLYGDWQRLSRRLETMSAGVPQAVLSWSGLGGARTVMASLAAEGTQFTGTLLLDFDARGGAANDPDAVDAEIDGWFAATQSVPARTLLSTLPNGGLGGLVVAVDLAQIAQRSPRGARMLREVGHALDEYGLDFQRNVLGRLGTGGTVQLLFRETAGVPEIVSVYSLRAKSKKAALDLFQDVRRSVEGRGMGQLVAAPGAGRTAVDVLVLNPPRHRDGERRDGDMRERPPHRGGFADGVCLAVYDDSILIGVDVDTVALVHEEYRRSARSRSKRDAAVEKSVTVIGADRVAGLFDLDLRPLFEQIIRGLGAPDADAEPIDLSRIPQRHTGYLDVQSHAGGSVLRIRVLSAR